MGRGGKELNNALVCDMNHEHSWSEYMIDRLLETETDPELFKMLYVAYPQIEYSFFNRLAIAVRAGN